MSLLNSSKIRQKYSVTSPFLGLLKGGTTAHRGGGAQQGMGPRVTQKAKIPQSQSSALSGSPIKYCAGNECAWCHLRRETWETLWEYSGGFHSVWPLLPELVKNGHKLHAKSMQLCCLYLVSKQTVSCSDKAQWNSSASGQLHL